MYLTPRWNHLLRVGCCRGFDDQKPQENLTWQLEEDRREGARIGLERSWFLRQYYHIRWNCLYEREWCPNCHWLPGWRWRVVSRTLGSCSGCRLIRSVARIWGCSRWIALCYHVNGNSRKDLEISPMNPKLNPWSRNSSFACKLNKLYVFF